MLLCVCMDLICRNGLLPLTLPEQYHATLCLSTCTDCTNYSLTLRQFHRHVIATQSVHYTGPFEYNTVFRV